MNSQKPERTEIWLRKIYRPFAETKALTTIFRPGRRLLSEGHPKALGVGEKVRIRVIDKVGADWTNLSAELMPAPNLPVIITRVTIKTLGVVHPQDFRGSTPDVADLAGLKMQLALIYNLSNEEMGPDFWITQTTFLYQETLGRVGD